MDSKLKSLKNFQAQIYSKIQIMGLSLSTAILVSSRIQFSIKGEIIHILSIKVKSTFGMEEYDNLVFNFPDSQTFSINKVRYNIILI